MKILVPIDFSRVSVNSIEIARKIAAKSSGTVHLVNFIAPTNSEGFTALGEGHMKHDVEQDVYQAELIKTNEEKLANLAAIHNVENSNLHVVPHVEIGDFSAGFTELTNTKDFDLIVMGTTGEKHNLEKLFGNHTEKVLKEVDIPVISVQENATLANLEDILVAIDLKEEDKNSVNQLVKFANLMNAKLHLYHLIPKNSSDDIMDIKLKIREYADRHSIEKYSVKIDQSNHVARSIASYANELNADLIAMFTKDYKGMKFYLHNSETEEVIETEENIPVFAINSH